MKDVRDAAQSFSGVVASFARDPRVTPPAPTRGSFGSNGLEVDGRIFAMLVRGALVVKLPRERVAELIESRRGEAFDAGKGRAMKEWVTLRAPETWIDLAREARTFVGGDESTKRPGASHRVRRAAKSAREH